MNKKIDKAEEKKFEYPKHCKGLFFRCRESRFINSKGEIVHRTGLYPLKRLSCPGCPQCEYVYEVLPEVDYDLGGDILKPGKIYTIQIDSWQDYWTGEYDEELYWKEVKEEPVGGQQ